MSISYILLFVDKIFPYVYTLIRIGLSGPLSLLEQVPMSGPLDLVLMGNFNNGTTTLSLKKDRVLSTPGSN